MMIHSAALSAATSEDFGSTEAHPAAAPAPARSAPNRYRSDLRELRFLLFEQLGLGELLGKPPFDSWGREEVELTLDGIDRFVREVFGPLNSIGDSVGCRLEK